MPYQPFVLKYTAVYTRIYINGTFSLNISQNIVFLFTLYITDEKPSAANCNQQMTVYEKLRQKLILNPD